MDLDAIPPVVWATGSAASMFGLLFWLLATGRLLTRSQHQEIVAPKDETIAFQRDTIELLTKATQNLAVPAHTSSMALRSIARSAESSKGGDE